MRAFRALVWNELLWYRGYPLSLLNLALSPAFLVAPYLLFAQLFGVDEAFKSSVAVGLILWHWLSTLIWDVGYGLENELEGGTLESLLVTPISIVTMLAAKGVVAIFRNVYITATMVSWLLAFRVTLDLPWALFIGVAFLGGLALSGFMLVLAGSVLLLKESEGLGTTLQTVLGVLSGVTISPQLFPTGLWILSRVIPLTYAIEAARRLLQAQSIANQALWLAATGGVYLVMGVAVVRWAERRMKTAGTTGEF